MKDNIVRLKLSHQLLNNSKKTRQNIWKAAGRKIAGPRQNRSLINVSEIAKNTKGGSIVLVAGKVLGNGEIPHAVNVGALSFSEGARLKIEKAGGKCFGLEEFMNKNKSAKDVKILG